MGERDIELGRLNASTTSPHGPQHYFQEVKEFALFLENTASFVQKLKEANLQFCSVTESDAMKEIKGGMEKDMDEVGMMAHNMKQKLKIIFQGVLTPIMNHLSNGRGYSATLPMTMDPTTMSMTRALKIKFKERENDLKNLRKTIWEEYLEVVQRRTFTVTGIKFSDEVIRTMDAGSAVQMFQNVLQGICPEQAVSAVDEIKERHAAAMDFDKKILDLEQNFTEMAALVETREKIDKALNQVKKVVARARSTDDENERLLGENDRLSATVIVLAMFLCAHLAYILVFLL